MDLKCQHCGFKVFNRRYPKCESCGATLVEGIALSATEREELFEQEQVAADEIWREGNKQADKPPNSLDDGSSLMVATMLASSGSSG